MVNADGELASTSTCLTPILTCSPAAAVVVTEKAMFGLFDGVFGSIATAFGPPVARTEPGEAPATVSSIAKLTVPAPRRMGPLLGPGSILTRPSIRPPTPTLSGMVSVTVTFEGGNGFWLNLTPVAVS